MTRARVAVAPLAGRGRRPPPGGPRRGRPAGALVVLLALATGCPQRVGLPDVKSLTDETATARILGAAKRRERMVGVVKARLPGLQGVVASVDLDVAAQPPDDLSVAVRSFFEQPMQMLVTDGSLVTVFDATQGQPVFLRGPVTQKALAKLLPVPLWPHEVVEVFLARPPDDARGILVSVDEKEATYTVSFERTDHAPFHVTARASDDAVVRWKVFFDDGRPLLDVTYKDLRPVGDAVLPFAWDIVRLDTSPNQELHFVAVDVTFNGPALPADAFRLDPPPGISLLPL